MLTNLSPRDKNSLIICILAILVGVYYFGVIQPLKGSQTALEEQRSAAQKKFKKEKSLIQESQQMAVAYESYLPLFNQDFSNPEQMSAIVAEIESVAAQINLRFSEIKPGKVRKEDSYNIFSVSLSTEGRFEDMAHFLYLLQSKPHLFQVEDLHMEKNGQAFLKTELVVSRLFIPQSN